MAYTYKKNDELKRKSHKVLIDVDTLETLRRTWFEMGYNIGSRERGRGDVEEEYWKIRRPVNEE